MIKHRNHLLLAFAAVAGYACWAKGSDFFAPTLTSSVTPPPPPPIDITGPVFSNIVPIAGIGALNSNHFGFTVADVAGSNGATPSGVDPATVSAMLASGTLLPLTANGLNYSGSFTGVSDGPGSFYIGAKDKAGNFTGTTVNFDLVRTPPIISLTTTPPPQTTSNAASVQFTIGGSITDQFFSSAHLTVTQPGPDGVCNTADDVPFPVGTTGGTVSQNSFNLSAGTFSTTITTYNGVQFGGTPHTAIYCGAVTASDNAQDETGASKPNTATTFWQSNVLWNPQPALFNWSLTASCTESTGFGTVFLSAATSPAQPNISYSATLTGPTGGVQGSGLFSGSLNSQGITTLQNNVNFQGTYNFSILANGVTGNASTNVGVDCH